MLSDSGIQRLELFAGGTEVPSRRWPLEPSRGIHGGLGFSHPHLSRKQECAVLSLGAFAIELLGAHPAKALVAIMSADGDPRRSNEGDDAGQTEEEQESDEYGEGRQEGVACHAAR